MEGRRPTAAFATKVEGFVGSSSTKTTTLTTVPSAYPQIDRAHYVGSVIIVVSFLCLETNFSLSQSQKFNQI
jgi:hypothetical protein